MEDTTQDGERLAARSPAEVLSDHLSYAAGDWGADLERNVHPDVVVLTGFGVFEGRDQVRVLAELLEAQLPRARFEYTTVAVRGEVGLLEWRADADGARVRDGVDSFVIREGRIVAQTIHYTVELTGPTVPWGTGGGGGGRSRARPEGGDPPGRREARPRGGPT